MLKLRNPRIALAGRRLAFLGASPRADWRAVLAVGVLAIVAGVALAQSRLGAVREIAVEGELRRGGEDTLVVPEAGDVTRAMAERGEVPVAGATTTAAAATSTSGR